MNAPRQHLPKIDGAKSVSEWEAFYERQIKRRKK